MSLETTTTINGLVATNPAATDPKSQGDDHIRMIKAVLKAAFPNLSRALFGVVAVSANRTLITTDNFSHFVVSGNRTLTVPLASVGNPFVFLVSSSADPVVVDPTGGTILGRTNVTMPPATTTAFISDGVELRIIGMWTGTNSFTGLQSWAPTVSFDTAASSVLNIKTLDTNSVRLTGPGSINEIIMDTGTFAFARIGGSANVTIDHGAVGTDGASIVVSGAADYVAGPNDVMLIYKSLSTVVNVIPFLSTGKLLPNQYANAATDSTFESTLADIIATPEWVRGYINAQKFTSAEQAFPAAATMVSVSHGLGAVPFSYSVHLRCKTAELGYAVGDEVQITSNIDADGGRRNATSVNETSITFTPLINNYFLPVKNTAAPGNITAANWRLVFRAQL